jgi:MHS family alpha-ketoglutarate permease-like MFS transporter
VAGCAAVSVVVYVTVRETKDLDPARSRAAEDSGESTLTTAS